MRNRVMAWAAAGFIVAGLWALYFYPTARMSAKPMWTLVFLTCPVALASDYFHFPVGIYASMLANAATYALIGLTIETLRHRLIHAR